MILDETAVETDVEVDHAPLLERAFSLDLTEEEYAIERIEGDVPDFIRGSYYLNGPARFQRGDQRYRHWLDGDGMVCALHFDDTGVRFANRYVRSSKLLAEEEAGRPLFRTFGTAFESDRLKRGIGLESPVNVSVYPAFGTLLAFGEQGLPWQLDQETLKTRGEYDFGGRLNPISPFSAHPNVDYATGEMFNFGVSFSARRPQLTIYRFGDDASLVYRRRLPLEFPCSLHDFGISAGYVTFYLSPYVLHMEELMGGASLIEALHWEPERGSRLVITRRADGDQVTTVPIGSAYSLHQINCFERDGLLAVDVVELDRPIYDQYQVPNLFTEVRRSQPVRYLIDPRRGRLVERTALDFSLMCDFPAIDTRAATGEYNDFWVLAISQTERPGRKFFDRLVRLDWRQGAADHYQAPPRHYLGGEPVFVADPEGDGGGAVICQQFDAEARSSSFLVFDAFDLARGPVAVLGLRQPVHLGFHAAFEPLAGR